jgi:hypothetical protein
MIDWTLIAAFGGLMKNTCVYSIMLYSVFICMYVILCVNMLLARPVFNCKKLTADLAFCGVL